MDTLDGPSSRGSRSLAVGRSSGKPRRESVETISQSSFYANGTGTPSFSSLLNGAPAIQPGQRYRRAALQKKDAEYQPQHRNAKNTSQSSPLSSRALALTTPPRKGVKTRSSSRNGITIEISDSESENEAQGSPLNSRPKTAAERQSDSPEVADSSEQPKQQKVAHRRLVSPSVSPSASNTATGSSAAGRSKYFNAQHEQPSSSSIIESPPVPRRSASRSELDASRPFAIASERDAQVVVGRRREQMKDRNGHLSQKPEGKTKSMLPASSLFRSRLDVSQGRSEEPVTIEIGKVAFSGLGYFGETYGVKASWLRPNRLQLSWKSRKSTADNLVSKGRREELIIEVPSLGEISHTSNVHRITRDGAAFIRAIKFRLEKSNRAYEDLVEKLATSKMGAYAPRMDHVDVIGIATNSVTDEAWFTFVDRLRRHHTDCIELTQEGLERAREEADDEGELHDSLYAKYHSFSSSPPQSRPRPKPRPSVRDVSDDRQSSTVNVRSSDINSKEDINSKGTEQGRSPSLKIHEDPNRQRLCFPFEGARAVTVFQSDIDKLDNGEFLNDTIIEFGLKYLLAQIEKRDPELHDQIYVFSSFFYKRFNERKQDRSRGYELVKKWTSRVDLFKKKYLVVPINEHLHWYLAIVTNPFLAFPEEVRKEKQRKDVYQDLGTVSSEADRDKTSDGEAMLPVDNIADTDAEIHPLSDEGLAADEEEEQESQRALQHDDRDQDDDTFMASDMTPFPVRDTRSKGFARQVPSASQSDNISNAGQGSLAGGGDDGKRKATPIVPGQCFSVDDDEVAQSSSALKRQDSSVAGTAFSNQSTPRSSPVITRKDYIDSARSLRSSGTTPVPGLSLERRSSVPPESVTNKWRTQLREGATVCVFDSLQGRHMPVRTAMRSYLSLEMADKWDVDVEAKLLDLEMIDVAMPAQTNYCDCGLYLLHAFERFFSDPTHFKEEVIPSRDPDHASWDADKALISRDWWRKVVLALADQWQAEHDRRLELRKMLKRKRKADEKVNSETEEGDDDRTGAGPHSSPQTDRSHLDNATIAESLATTLTHPSNLSGVE